ncbi:VPS13 domain-containing protein [Mycena chlorophos]|uniref:VPS13 domain-containing protein n=1 Tax=Mycena chlorophos TaxID=658473 RepID=A0A8H6TLC7_MYCCL|nr:VPS13 domain-containing protein [Mycena chlorophos]
MPSLPRLLKRLSSKSLKKSKQGSSDEGTPPLKTAASEASFGEVIAGSGTRFLNGSADASPHGTVTAPLVPPVPPLPEAPPPQIQAVIPQDALSVSLQDAWKSANTDPKKSKADKLLQSAETAGMAAMARETTGAAELAVVETELTAVGVLDNIESGIRALAEGMPVLMNALDEVAKLHPFIGVAVMAFKAVWALEQKRRDNDKKILALHVEMKDMMGVLTQLKNVTDPDALAPDGSTIKGRMQVIIETAAKNIKACANACDTYVKKKLVVKVIKGPIWEGRLAAFSGEFTKRKSEFEFAMSIHTALGVDAAVRGISSLTNSSQAIEAKIDIMMKLFAQMATPDQKDMARLVDQKGGASVLDNDKALKELNDIENKSLAAQAGSREKHTGTLADLKEDLRTSPDAAMDANMELFSRKFAVQQRQIIEELSHVVERQGDRIIGAVLAGPHDRIIDPNVHAVWKEMGWRGSVKTRHFVMALRDHFQEDFKHHHNSTEAESPKEGEPAEEKEFVPPIPKADEWTLDFINVVRLQPISEAFDDDASGFVTIAEVNAFTTSRPLDWSLARWIAYWSIGHHQTMIDYADKINQILSKMFAILPFVLPDNKSAVNRYLKTIYESVYSLVGSLDKRYINTVLQAKFESYVNHEEERIRSNLEAVKYDLDDLATLDLVIGEGRIEKFVFPVLYLLMKRHFEIFRVCQTHAVSSDELWDAADTIIWVFDAVRARLELLQSIFKQQKLDVEAQFKSFSFGLYEVMNNPDILWAAKVVQEMEFGDYDYLESLEDPLTTELDKILNYPFDQEPLDLAAYALRPPPTTIDPSTVLEGALPLLSNRWHGFNYDSPDAHYPTAGMLSMTFEPTSLDDNVQTFATSERANMVAYNVKGDCHVAEDDASTMFVTFRRIFATGFVQHFHALWKIGSNTLSGTYGEEEDPYDASLPPIELQSTSDDSGQNPKARALWAFAINATIQRIRREGWSWSFFKERRDNRKRFIELYIRSGHGNISFGKYLDESEMLELARIKKSFTTRDSRFYHSLADKQLRATTQHGCFCDNCGGAVGGARISCMVCQVKGTWDSVDFDESVDCFSERVMRDDLQRPHLPHHDLIKLRRVLHIRDWGKTFRRAREGMERARTIMKAASPPVEESTVSDASKRMSMAAKRLSVAPKSALANPEKTAAGTGPRCANCAKTLSLAQPSWFCVFCEQETFICWECDAKGESGIANLLGKKESEHDFNAHDLVRVQEKVEDKDLTTDERLDALEETVRTVNERLAKMETAVEERMGRLEETVEKKMGKIESMLEQLLAQ